MKVIVTGAGGFLGRSTVEYLRHKGHEVTAFTQDVRRNLPYERFDCVYHFAAYVGGRKGIDNNKWLITENIELDRITFKWAEEWCKKINAAHTVSMKRYIRTKQKHVFKICSIEPNLIVCVIIFSFFVCLHTLPYV